MTREQCITHMSIQNLRVKYALSVYYVCQFFLLTLITGVDSTSVLLLSINRFDSFNA